MPTALVEAATNRFMEEGGVPNGTTILQVTLNRNPDARKEWYYPDDPGNPAGPDYRIRAKAADDIAAWDRDQARALAAAALASIPTPLEGATTWRGIFTDADPTGVDDCVWLRYSTGAGATVQLRTRREGVVRVLLSQAL